jgi:putative PIN family toxin of toxin-antitoxin system
MSALIPKIVIDTNIYISAIFWGGKPREIVELGRSGHILVFSSSEIAKEIDEKLRLKFKLDADETIQIILDFSTFTIPVKITKRIKAVNEDPDDDKFVECAASCGADYIVSGDKHLLKLKEYEGIKIISAASFLSFFNKTKPNCPVA